MTTSTLSFGDTFTLPVTGDLLWKIRDARPAFAHLLAKQRDVGLRHTAYAKCETDEGAFYTPGEGWTASGVESKGAAIVEQLSELDVDLPHKSAEDWSVAYRRMLGTETRSDVRDIVNLVETWTTGTDIDALDLRAHVAATAALTAAGTPDNVTLFTAVYTATLAALREEAAA